jgi:hypothetical protein
VMLPREIGELLGKPSWEHVLSCTRYSRVAAECAVDHDLAPLGHAQA